MILNSYFPGQGNYSKDSQHDLVNLYYFLIIMLSARGQAYSALDLAAGYLKERGPLYDKDKYPSGLVSLTNAENVWFDHFDSWIVSTHANRCNQQFLMQEKMLHFIKTKVSRNPDVAFVDLTQSHLSLYPCSNATLWPIMMGLLVRSAWDKRWPTSSTPGFHQLLRQQLMRYLLPAAWLRLTTSCLFAQLQRTRDYS